MAKILFFLGLIVLQAVGIVSGVDLSDIFAIQPGTSFGGCDARANVLDNWHQEAIDSLDLAVAAIELRYNENSVLGEQVRQAMFEFFKVPPMITQGNLKATAARISKNIALVRDLFNGILTNINPDNSFLFCDSNYLVQKDAANDDALDYLGNPIIVNGNPIKISAVPAYARDLTGSDVPWWTGDHAPFKGYYFDTPDSGGRYCASTNLGLTSALKALTQGQTMPQLLRKDTQSVNICPYAFDRADRPDSYAQGVAAIMVGTSLEPVVPKSSTLIHEAFHVVFGTQFLAGKSEYYGLAKCIDTARVDPVGKARKNPENYVYFVAAMTYLTGGPDEGINTNWDFTNGPARVP
ncbi:hypothetical protein F5Y10DRAFT_267965 [Nemania abortiva]|nr:hypothetical protein F5Y10DRAFT_267965 [Nemania abortiva]